MSDQIDHTDLEVESDLELESEPEAPLTMLASPRRAIEAVLMAATDPVPARELAQLIEIPVPEVERIVSELAEEYAHDQRIRDRSRCRWVPVPDACRPRRVCGTVRT